MLLSQMLHTVQISLIDTSGSASDGRRRIASHSYDLVIINAPLRDESGEALAADITKDRHTGVLLLVKAEMETQIEQRVAQYGVFVLSKPINQQFFYKALHLLDAVQHRFYGVENENIRLKQKIDEARIVSRAKSILMEYLSMTEPQAQKKKKKQAMDLRITKLEVAKRLLSTYEN